MPALFLDLDDTLIDRASAFRGWAEELVRDHRLSGEDLDWLITVDREGYEPRERVAAAILERFGLTGWSVDDLAADLRHAVVERLVLAAEVPRALAAARDAGWVPVVVTNGALVQQERKLRRTGLDRLVAGWVVSEAAGCAKPDPRIFDLAARVAGRPLDGAWMIGDSAANDIGGAHAAGLDSVWVHHGRTWHDRAFAPSVIVDTCPAAIDHVVVQPRSGLPDSVRR
ncbi:HAD family hydrolase [Jiangella asiatica]|uniref:HAD family hydrolase n=1 Tax=Jiangella asiatica TaxID=2530372 RepID=A0A4R5CN23_9ACTN|nr:HAD family hydrolase [Jiangella asiatica]TDE00660.1 HAD family hydrolase [Jiangella asiatica]